jgi:hypothetical protein
MCTVIGSRTLIAGAEPAGSEAIEPADLRAGLVGPDGGAGAARQASHVARTVVAVMRNRSTRKVGGR